MKNIDSNPKASWGLNGEFAPFLGIWGTNFGNAGKYTEQQFTRLKWF